MQQSTTSWQDPVEFQLSIPAGASTGPLGAQFTGDKGSNILAAGFS